MDLLVEPERDGGRGRDDAVVRARARPCRRRVAGVRAAVPGGQGVDEACGRRAAHRVVESRAHTAAEAHVHDGRPASVGGDPIEGPDDVRGRTAPVAAQDLDTGDRGTGHEYSYNLVDDGYTDTAPAGNYPAGASPYGAYDMAGNVWEWTTDWYSRTYYTLSPYKNPTGPESGTLKILRGGSYNNSNWGIRSTTRSYLGPLYAYGYVGFRCAISE